MNQSGSGNILLCAPDAEHRNSLLFWLTAEGFRVVGCATWPTDYEGVIDAVVIDEGGLGQGFADDGSLAAFGPKVISLSSEPGGKAPWPTTIIRTPLIDRMLVEVLHEVLALAPAPCIACPC